MHGRRPRYPQVLYPYFISNILLMFGIAALLSLGLWLAVRLGL